MFNTNKRLKMKNLTINVSDMQTPHCQTTVSNAITKIAGVQIQYLEAGKVSVFIETDQLENEVIKTIQQAGYTVTPRMK